MERCLKQHKLKVDQEFIVFPDPIYWQIPSTLIYEKIMKFIKGLPITRRTEEILPPKKAVTFYRQAQDAPLNHGNLTLRSCGKNTLMRQYVFGKRCTLAMRGTISADSSLEPCQMRVPVKLKHLLGKHVLVNRMPSLQPENVINLQVAKTWEYDCFGLPLEVLESLHADFDGDEINVWILESIQAQAECMFLLNSKMDMGSKTIGLKLAPCQDMLVVFYINFDKINFLPYKDPNRNLKKTFRVIYDLYGSAKTYECINAMRLYYLEVMENEIVFSITLEEIQNLICQAEKFNSYEEFEKKIKGENLIVQIKSGAKGSLYHLYQMFKCIGPQADGYVSSSFWKGLDPWEAVLHAKISFDALLQSGKIWEPGYGYSKNVFNLQGLHVDYQGRLVDGKIMIEKDVLNTMDRELILSDDAFNEILKRHLLEDQDQSKKCTKKMKVSNNK
ncbi:hypothetical protein HNY73_001056 [Argiope bruennichi]|uniref:DNA-directed RNA polymerase n=1 Tax=Argiope bruennichi TaxID=94029 RepID=A0A8T0G3S8_ARGBR|nr:hypothetical protein HNY73_001056 [Argiope bruennichi]